MNLARLAATLVAVTVITSCSDDPEPRTEPSETPTSSATESSEPPEVLGPEETVRAWVDGVNKAFTGGDVTGRANYRSLGCKSCRDSTSP